MRNDTESKIIITMKNIDQSQRLFDFLSEMVDIGNCGGDLELTVSGCKDFKKTIGHDVSIKDLRLVIDGVSDNAKE